MSTERMQGNRLTLGDLIVDIYLRDGVAYVTERRGGRTETFTAGEWSRLRRGGAVLAQAHRRGELGIESLLPEAQIEAMHAARRPRRAAAWLDRIVRLFGGLRPAA